MELGDFYYEGKRFDLAVKYHKELSQNNLAILLVFSPGNAAQKSIT